MNIRDYVELLRQLYEENNYPSDRLFREPVNLNAFTREFNGRAKAEFSADAVARELERVRKDKEQTGGLPRIGRTFHGPKFRGM